MASASKRNCKDSIRKCVSPSTQEGQVKHALWHEIVCLKCVYQSIYVALLIPYNTETQFSLSLEKHGEFVMVQLLIMIYYSTS